MATWGKFKRWSELEKVAALASDKTQSPLIVVTGLVASARSDRACNLVDWAYAMKSRPTYLPLNHQWVLGFVRAWIKFKCEGGVSDIRSRSRLV